MKGFLVSVAGLGVGGAAWFGMDSPDFDRTINRSPTAVYNAFAALSNEGTVTETAKDGTRRSVSLRTVKEHGEAITYEILLDDRPVVTAELAFAPAGEGGTATRMTAELDIDAYEIGSLYETEAGLALSMVPDTYFDIRFAEFMNDLVDDVEAGRPLRPFDARSVGVRRHDSPDADTRNRETARAQRAAVRPMTDARPMVDPNAAAEAHRRGQPDPDGAWGR